MYSIPLAMSCDNTCECFLPEKLIRDSVPKIFMETGHVGMFCLECTKVPDSQKGSR